MNDTEVNTMPHRWPADIDYLTGNWTYSQERASEMSMLSPEALTRDGSDPRWSSARTLVFFDPPPNAANWARNSQ